MPPTRDSLMYERKDGRVGSTTTIAIHKSTKEKLDRNKAPGQCYNGFICQLLDLWEKTVGENPLVGNGNQGA